MRLLASSLSLSLSLSLYSQGIHGGRFRIHEMIAAADER